MEVRSSSDDEVPGWSSSEEEETRSTFAERVEATKAARVAAATAERKAKSAERKMERKALAAKKAAEKAAEKAATTAAEKAGRKSAAAAPTGAATPPVGQPPPVVRALTMLEKKEQTLLEGVRKGEIDLVQYKAARGRLRGEKARSVYSSDSDSGSDIGPDEMEEQRERAMEGTDLSSVVQRRRMRASQDPRDIYEKLNPDKRPTGFMTGAEKTVDRCPDNFVWQEPHLLGPIGSSDRRGSESYMDDTASSEKRGTTYDPEKESVLGHAGEVMRSPGGTLGRDEKSFQPQGPDEESRRPGALPVVKEVYMWPTRPFNSGGLEVSAASWDTSTQLKKDKTKRTTKSPKGSTKKATLGRLARPRRTSTSVPGDEQSSGPWAGPHQPEQGKQGWTPTGPEPEPEPAPEEGPSPEELGALAAQRKARLTKLSTPTRRSGTPTGPAGREWSPAASAGSRGPMPSPGVRAAARRAAKTTAAKTTAAEAASQASGMDTGADQAREARRHTQAAAAAAAAARSSGRARQTQLTLRDIPDRDLTGVDGGGRRRRYTKRKYTKKRKSKKKRRSRTRRKNR